MSKQELPEKTGPNSDTGPLKRIGAIAAACAILALPITYLVSYYFFPAQASAHPAAPDRRADDLSRALSLIRANAPASAVPILKALVTEDPNNAVAWNDLCVAHTMLKSYQEAIDECNKAIHLAPDMQLARNNLKWAQDEAAKVQKSLAGSEQVAPAQRSAGDYIAEGLNFLHAGNYDEAIRAWKRALELDPRNALAANNIGAAYMSKGQPKIALAWFQKSLALDPTLQIAKNNLAWATGEIAKLDK